MLENWQWFVMWQHWHELAMLGSFLQVMQPNVLNAFRSESRSVSWDFMWFLYVIIYEGFISKRKAIFLTCFGIYFTLVWRIEIYFFENEPVEQ